MANARSPEATTSAARPPMYPYANNPSHLTNSQLLETTVTATNDFENNINTNNANNANNTNYQSLNHRATPYYPPNHLWYPDIHYHNTDYYFPTIIQMTPRYPYDQVETQTLGIGRPGESSNLTDFIPASNNMATE